MQNGNNDNQRIRIGFLMIGGEAWRGGLNYQRTLLELITGPLRDHVEARVFVSHDQQKLAQETFGDVLETACIVDDRVAGAGTGRRGFTAMITGRDRHFLDLLNENKIDVVFETAKYFGWRLPIPAIAWMPDFQHRFLPHLFPRLSRWRRDFGFRAQTFGARVIMLSSETARQNCEDFYPRSRGNTHVVRFAPKLAFEAILERAETVKDTYELPDRFFYLPNQLWTHKNHVVVLEALEHLNTTGQLEAIPPVVMSGSQSDHRSEGLFESLMTRARSAGVAEKFRHLGLIPFNDVLALNAAAEAVLNPSLFEGWASAVEEAKALSTPLILSDIPLHREQAPAATFFPPHNAAALAATLQEMSARLRLQPATPGQLADEQQTRIDDFANSFLDAVRAADAHNRQVRTHPGKQPGA